MSGESEKAAFAEGEGVGEAAGRNTERADVLAFLARKRANAELIATRTPEFADGARQTIRELDILHDHIAGGLHEGAAFTTAVLAEPEARAAKGLYPFREHRSLAELDSIKLRDELARRGTFQ